MAKKDLVIVESPAKARTIEKYLGSDYKVVASMGHLRDLPKNTMGVDIEHGFEPNYQPVKGREAVIDELKKASKSAGTVYLATDPDREGEAISWHLKAGAAGRQGAPHHLQRDHEKRCARGTGASARHRSESGRRAAGAPHP